MSDYKLNTHVHAVEVDSKGARTGREGTFGPDDDLSTPDNEWALAAITNRDVWASGRAPERKAPEPVEDPEVAALKARIAELERAQLDAEVGKSSGDDENEAGEKPAATQRRSAAKPAAPTK